MRRQGGSFILTKIIIILALTGTGFFYGQKILASQNILINEVLISPPENRFIELYNPNNFSIDLTGWYLQRKTSTGASFSSLVSKTNFENKTIAANGYFLITRVFAESADIVLSTLTLSDSNIIQLKNSDQEIIDLVEWSLAPEDGKSLERKTDGTLQASQNIGGTPRAQNSAGAILLPTAQCGNAQVENNEQCDDGNLVSGDGCDSTCQTETDPAPPPLLQEEDDIATSTEENISSPNPPNPLYQGGNKFNFGDILINELVSDPADGEVEWIELYNKSGKEIDLSGWRLEEGSKAKTNLSGLIGASDSGRYKIIDKPSGNLNNAGDIIILFEPSGKIIDQVVYGNWDDGNLTDNAPAASDPGSLARKFDSYNTYNNLNDFSITLRPTKGASNIIEVETEISAEAKINFDFSNDIFISEILPNPAGLDTKSEFIEIYNAGTREVNLSGWSLSNKDNKKINFEKITASTIIKAGEYLALFRPETKIVLHNDQGEVKLFQPLADRPFMSLDYKNVKEGWSYNLETPLTPLLKGGGISDEWVWSETITPGEVNAIKTINHAPEVEFSLAAEVLIGRPVIFDGSDTFDQDGDKLKYVWDFGDGFKNNLANPEHTYLKLGIYKVKLEVSDSQATSTKEKITKVVESVEEMNDILDSPFRKNDGIVKEGGEDIIINEILPNPVGADTGQEWIELVNQSSNDINLLNLQIKNSNGKYKFNESQSLAAGAFYVLDNSQSKLALKNTDDVISLANDLDELIDQVEYISAIQGESYARGFNGNWFWTTKLTPGEENLISVAASQANLDYEISSLAGSINGYVETDLEMIRTMAVGSLVKVKGTVAVKPGILGTQIFYIVGSPGLQVYNYKKDFPALKVGDYIEVAGELTLAQGELRLKTKDKNDISLIEAKAPPVSLPVQADEVSEENLGQLIAITGEITDKKSTSLYVDDGSDEIFVYIKQSTGIDTKNLKAGQNISVSGILSQTQTGLRLLPRFQEDLIIINSADEITPQVLGEVVVNQEWALAERDKKLELFKYLLIISVGVIIILGILFMKAKRKA